MPVDIQFMVIGVHLMVSPLVMKKRIEKAA
jgi:hypothetical protein